MIVTAQQPCFLPWVGYWHKMASADKFLSMNHTKYVHGEFFNRVRLNGQWLTLPVVTGTHVPLEETRFDLRVLPKLVKTIQHTCARMPCKERLIPLYEFMLNWERSNLVDFNTVTNGLVCSILGIADVTEVAPVGEGDDVNQRLWDMLSKVPGASEYYSGSGGLDYMEPAVYPMPVKFQSITNAYKGESIVQVIAQEEDLRKAVLSAGEWL